MDAKNTDNTAGASGAICPGGKGWQPGEAQYGYELAHDLFIDVVDDGIRLEAGVTWPTDTVTGKRSSGTFPVLVEFTPYQRQDYEGLRHTYLVEHGYIVAQVHPRSMHTFEMALKPIQYGLRPGHRLRLVLSAQGLGPTTEGRMPAEGGMGFLIADPAELTAPQEATVHGGVYTIGSAALGIPSCPSRALPTTKSAHTGGERYPHAAMSAPKCALDAFRRIFPGQTRAGSHRTRTLARPSSWPPSRGLRLECAWGGRSRARGRGGRRDEGWGLPMGHVLTRRGLLGAALPACSGAGEAPGGYGVGEVAPAADRGSWPGLTGIADASGEWVVTPRWAGDPSSGGPVVSAAGDTAAVRAVDGCGRPTDYGYFCRSGRGGCRIGLAPWGSGRRCRTRSRSGCGRLFRERWP